MPAYQLFEWEARRFDAARPIPAQHAAALVKAAAAPAARLKGRQQAFDFRRDALVAQNLVGVIAAPEATCEILPKVDREAAGDPQSLRHQLIGMLAVAHDLPVADDVVTALGTQNVTLLEILIARFSAMLGDAIRRGLPRAYIAHENDLPALRGRLDIIRQFSTLAATPHRLACQFDEFSPDIPLNQAIKAAVARLRILARSYQNQRALADLALVYADVRTVEPSRIGWHAIVPDRANMRWMALVRLARLILGDRFQNSVQGSADGFALLFDMNVLFENYVEKLLAPVARTLGWTLRAQGGRKACLHPRDGGAGLFETLPDIQLVKGHATDIVIDTKWKALVDPSADPKMNVSQSDIYQLMAYAQLYECRSLILLYPHHGGLASPLPVQFRVGTPTGPVHLSIGTVDLASHDSARKSLAGLLALQEKDARAAASA